MTNTTYAGIVTNEYGDRVHLYIEDVRIKRYDVEQRRDPSYTITMTDHSERRADQMLSFDASGSTWDPAVLKRPALDSTPRSERGMISGGQVFDGLQLAGRDANGSRLTDADVAFFFAAHAAYHLNMMNAACDHQAVTIGGEDAHKLVCKESGYRYGHAWLAREVPAEVLEHIARLFGLEVPALGAEVTA